MWTASAAGWGVLGIVHTGQAADMALVVMLGCLLMAWMWPRDPED